MKYLNWYKFSGELKISSHNLQFSLDLDNIIKEIATEVVEYFLNSESETRVLGQASFVDPYTSEDRLVNVILIAGQQDAFADYSVSDSSDIAMMRIFPYALHFYIDEFVDKDLLTKTAIHFLKHEFAHSIDPKFKNPGFIENQDYYLKPTEFDAYSLQITEFLRNNMNDNLKYQILEWIKNPQVDNLPDILYSNFYTPIFQWFANNKSYIKKLQQRIYNEFFTTD